MLPNWITPSGIIGNVIEGAPFNFNLIFSGSLPLTIKLISGQLPGGLLLNTNTGNISGTANLIELQETYEFTIRLTNSEGFADNGFSIVVNNQTPMWTNPSNLGSILPNFYAEIDFSVNDPGGSTPIFEKITGTLPAGLQINSFGKLYGIAENITVSTTYTFTLRALLDNTYIDKQFTLTVDPDANSQPIWLTPAGNIGNLIAGQSFGQIVVAESPINHPITYSIAPGLLPANLTLNTTTGVISGILSSSVTEIYTFSINANGGPGQLTSRIFNIYANQASATSITWLTPAGNLGSIAEGQKSTIAVNAQASDIAWLRYIISSGSLPTGLVLDINTGEIQGSPSIQVTQDTVFNFTITAYDEFISVTRDFSITLLSTYEPGATRVYATLFGKPKLVFTDLFTTPEIVMTDIYRLGDSNFGLIKAPKILIVENLNNPSYDQIAELLYGTRRTYLSFGKVEVGYAVENNQVIYEVLYRRIFDLSAGANEVINDNAITPHKTIRPGSVNNIRNELITAFGSSGNDVLPLWMTSEQVIGDSATIPGYTLCLEFAYMLPGTAAAIAQKINNNDIQLRKLYNNYIRMDRIVVEPTAATSPQPRIILFDNLY